MSISMTITPSPTVQMETTSPQPASMDATGGTLDHGALLNRNAADQHPMNAITGLPDALDEVDSDALTNFEILEIMQH